MPARARKVLYQRLGSPPQLLFERRYAEFFKCSVHEVRPGPGCKYSNVDFALADIVMDEEAKLMKPPEQATGRRKTLAEAFGHH